MSNESSQIYDLQKEWRAIVLEKLGTLERSQSEIKDTISDMKTTFANEAEFATLKGKVEDLEALKSKAVGFILACNLICGVVGWLISNILIK